MPRFFFNVTSTQDGLDREGTELPNLRAVRGEAVRTAGEMLRDIDGRLDGEEWVMEVTDEAGGSVLTLRFSAIEHS